ncbi:MAG: DUF2637 domain-containing protein [Actinomycetota bacterium]
MTTSDLHSLRRRVHAVLATALLASVVANVLAAEPTTVARAVAAWPPVALLLVVDVLGRAPTADGWTGRLSVLAAGLVASVAALASFAHVRHVALAVGESELVAWVLPLSVDGLAVVCSVALVEMNRRLRTEPQADQPSLLDPVGHVPVVVEPARCEPPPAAPVELNGHRPLVLFDSPPSASPGS